MMLKEFYFFESFIYWKDKLRERERDRKRERQIYTERKKRFSLIGSLPKWLQQPELV